MDGEVPWEENKKGSSNPMELPQGYIIENI